MASLDLISVLAVLLAVGGLVAVVAEILAKSPRGLLEMMEDSRRFAEGPRTPALVPAPVSTGGAAATPAAASSDDSERRLAA